MGIPYKNGNPCNLNLLMKEVILIMAKLDLTKYGITGATEIIHNPSYEVLFEAEMDPSLEARAPPRGGDSALGSSLFTRRY